MFRGVAPAIGLFGLLVPAMAHAQTNIDQGKSPAEVFANDCATCHKTARGLANGRNSLTLAGFLVEHYTASRDQASALAAYVMGAGGGDSAPATQARGPKTAPDRGAATAEEPKPSPRATREAAKPPDGSTAKPRQPGADEKRLGDVPGILAEPGPGAPGRRPAGRVLQPATATANRGRPKEPESTPPPQEPAAVVAEPVLPPAPAHDSSPASTPGPSAAAPAHADSGETTTVPRDDIPD